MQRVREAAAEIQKVAKKGPALAAAGALFFLEEVSLAPEHVDRSSGTIGTAVNHTIEVCARIIAAAPIDERTRDQEIFRHLSALTTIADNVGMRRCPSTQRQRRAGIERPNLLSHLIFRPLLYRHDAARAVQLRVTVAAVALRVA